MRLLWVLVVVGVAGAATAEKEDPGFKTLREAGNSEFTNTTQGEERSAEGTCSQAEGEELCKEGFFFTAAYPNKVRGDGGWEVVLTLEESVYPHVTFDLSLRKPGSGGSRLPEETILARKEVTLGVNELRRVDLRVNGLNWETAHFVLKAHPTGNPDLHNFNSPSTAIKKVNSDVEVFVQTEKSEFARGDTVDYRALVVDGNVDKTPKFAQVDLLTEVVDRELEDDFEWYERILFPWGDVTEGGIVRGNFTFDGFSTIVVRGASNVTSSDPAIAYSPYLKTNSPRSQWLTLWLEGLRDVYLSQPRVKGRVVLATKEGIPLEGNCNVTMEQNSGGDWTKFRRSLAERNLPAGGEFEFDVAEELGTAAREEVQLRVTAHCRHVRSGSGLVDNERIRFYRSLFRVDLLSVEIQPLLPSGTNSSHTQSTVVLSFHVERRDGGSVEEEEPTKGLHVKLLLSEENFRGLRPSATNFSLPIPPNGEVKLEFQVNDTPPGNWEDRIRMEVGDAKEDASLQGSPNNLLPDIHVTPVDPARLIRKGDVVRFRVRSCVHYANVNAIMSSAKVIFSSQRFSFSPQGGWLDEVIELTIPQNVTTGSLLLTVYGRNKNQFHRYSRTAFIQVNVVPSTGPQEIFVVDQVDVDMSTIVTFQLEGKLDDSVISLQAAKLESSGLKAEERDEIERPLRCHVDGYQKQRDKPQNKIWDDSPGAVNPGHLDFTSNFFISRAPFSPPRTRILIDVDRKTSTMDNGTLTATKTFDRTTQFGTYVVSGATFNSKSGRSVFSNPPALRILPPPVTLSISVPQWLVLGETLEVLGSVRNNLATPFEGHVTMESSGGGSLEVKEELVEIKPNSFKILKMQVTPVEVGDLVVSLRSNISRRLTATNKVKVYRHNRLNY